MKLDSSVQSEVQYNNDVIRNNYGTRLRLSCLRNHHIDLKKKTKKYIDYSFFSESHSIPLLDYKTPQSSC